MITEADIERVRAARGVAFLKDQAHAFIPAAAGNPDLAKKFLRFFCSDYAGSIYSTVTHGFSPFYVKVDETNKFLNGFDKTIADIVSRSEGKVLPWILLGVNIKTPNVEGNFFTPSTSQYGTPELFYNQYRNSNLQEVNGKSVWQTMLEAAGLKLL